MTVPTAELLRVPYRLGGRGADGIDCLGVVLAHLAELGLPQPDPWTSVAEEWQRTGRYGHGFPDGWSPAPAVPGTDGDVWILGARHDGVGVLRSGLLWTATQEAGVVGIDPARCRPRECWRFRP